ncbi:hypothetical protein PsYK624_101020 [Phanerochaete sordida]|uniref:Uncharacterized protein n=1 Tax=Phanerochaete sordida TaxID=48140 RepID=A0A9P3GDZ2_9APHY|nr:hypothetical protein PsYK624_101020 [Phanerochaete sordida]
MHSLDDGLPAWAFDLCKRARSPGQAKQRVGASHTGKEDISDAEGRFHSPYPPCCCLQQLAPVTAAPTWEPGYLPSRVLEQARTAQAQADLV